jgi:uncharacterized iron-regulated membrane protein
MQTIETQPRPQPQSNGAAPIAARQPKPSQQRSTWSRGVYRASLWLHTWLGVFLGLLMLSLSVTGVFVAFKNEVEYLQPAARAGAKGEIAEVVAPAQVAEIIVGLGLPEATTVADINRIELRPSKRMYKVRLEQSSLWRAPREIQVDAITGAILNDGVRGDQLWMDLHSLAVFGEATKLITMTLSGVSLVWLTLTGYYLWLHPHLLRNRRKAAAAASVMLTRAES